MCSSDLDRAAVRITLISKNSGKAGESVYCINDRERGSEKKKGEKRKGNRTLKIIFQRRIIIIIIIIMIIIMIIIIIIIIASKMIMIISICNAPATRGWPTPFISLKRKTASRIQFSASNTFPVFLYKPAKQNST